MDSLTLEQLADHVESHILDLVEAVSALQKQASEVLERREDEWRPIAVALTAWLQDAREAVKLGEKVKALKGAEAWLKEAFDEVRAARSRADRQCLDRDLEPTPHAEQRRAEA